MDFKCPRCLHPIEVADSRAGDLVVCPYCKMEVQTPTFPALLPARPLYSPVVVLEELREPRRHRDPEEEAERRSERREERDERREEREERRELRIERKELRVERKEQNLIAVVGFTISLACLLLMLGSLLLAGQATAYVVISVVIALPGALLGLICSLIGCLQWRVGKPIGVAGAVLGGVLLVVVIPLAIRFLIVN
jgi:hypothetical protein